jgi:lipopolysaccharide heptosyltransferase I
MSVKTRPPLRDYTPGRIALIKPSALGDIVHTLPVLSALRRRYPQAHITWVVNRSYESLLRGHPDLDATLPLDRAAMKAGLMRAALCYSRFLRTLRGQRFDLAIDLQGLFRSGLITAATGATRRVGLASAREGAVWFYTDVVPVTNFASLHAVDRYWLVAQALGASDGPKCFRLPIAEADRRWAADALGGNPRPWLVLGVGSRWMTKRWPPRHFGALARKAYECFGGTVIFIGGRDEKVLARKTAALLSGPVRDLTGQTTLPQLTAVLASADAVVANDTGPLHLAAALGRPVVAPYTCTKARRSGPYGSPAGAMEARVWCQGSYLKRCDRLECMAELVPDRLWPVLYNVLLTRERSR